MFFIDSVTREGLGKLIDYLGWNEDEKSDGKPDGKTDGKTDEKPTKEKAGKKQKASSVIKKSDNKGKKQRSAKA